MGTILFITGTDTAAGKTVLTALLLRHARASGRHAFGMKPFCSGGLHDVRTLAAAQDRELPLDQISPFRFERPVAPLLAARTVGRRICLTEALEAIRCMATRCELLLVEGAGGLLAPLGESFTARELIETLRCPVIVAARNRLGAINHSLLTLSALGDLPLPSRNIVLMNTFRGDSVSRTNPKLIEEFGGEKVFTLPFLGPNPTCGNSIDSNSEKLKKTLAAILESATLSPALGKSRGAAADQKLRKNSLAPE